MILELYTFSIVMVALFPCIELTQLFRIEKVSGWNIGPATSYFGYANFERIYLLFTIVKFEHNIL